MKIWNIFTKFFAVGRNHIDLIPLPNLYKSQFWSSEEQYAYQNDRFIKIFQFHYKHTIGYRNFCEQHGVSLHSVTSLEDMYKLPIIDRKLLQNNSAFRNYKYKHGGFMHTGGSTGNPLEYMGCTRYHTMRQKAHLRGWGYFGIKSADQFIVIASAQGHLLNAKNLSGNLDNEHIGEVIDAIKNSREKFLRGYTSSIYIVALHMVQNKQVNENILVINLISENVYPWQREIISKAFPNCAILEEYCCNDGGASAWECESHDGLHEAFERSIIEPAENGEMIVTDLWNRAMPFIRYRNGDYLLDRNLTKCTCGRTSSRIRVQGRTNDILITPTGPVSPTYLMLWSVGYGYTGEKHNSGITQIQFIQDSGYKLTVNIVKNSNFSEEDLIRLQGHVSKICSGMDIQYFFVEKIETSSSGKRNFIINNDKALLHEFHKGKNGDSKSYP